MPALSREMQPKLDPFNAHVKTHLMYKIMLLMHEWSNPVPEHRLIVCADPEPAEPAVSITYIKIPAIRLQK